MKPVRWIAAMLMAAFFSAGAAFSQTDPNIQQRIDEIIPRPKGEELILRRNPVSQEKQQVRKQEYLKQAPGAGKVQQN